MAEKQHICVKKPVIWTPALEWLFIGISASQLTVCSKVVTMTKGATLRKVCSRSGLC